jgi:hypothetical protein
MCPAAKSDALRVRPSPRPSETLRKSILLHLHLPLTLPSPRRKLLIPLFALILGSASALPFAPTRSIAAASRTATSGAEIESPLSRALELRGGAGGPLACITKDRTVTAYAAVWAFYGIQMLLIPQKVHGDYFASPGSEMINFWIRGQSACVGGFVCVERQPP